MALIRIPTGTWQELDGVQEPFSIRRFRGVSKLNPMSLEPGYATELSNLSAEGYPSLQVRGGMSRVVTLEPGVTGLGVYQDTTFLAISNGEAWKVTVVPGSETATPLQSHLNPFSNWSFTHFKGNFSTTHLLFTDGGSHRKFDGNTVSFWFNVPADLNYIASYANRVYGAVGNTLRFSALNKAEDWQTANDAGSIVVESPAGDITGIRPGFNRLVVFKRNSIHELYGTGPQNFRLALVTDRIGCVAHNSVVTLNGIMYWLGPDGIYEYGGGAAPRKDFSLPVQGYVDRITTTFADRACAATDGKRYYLALPVYGSSEPNIILEYDPTFQTWMVWDPPENVLSLAASEGRVFAGLADGRILKFDPNATTDDGQEISWVWESPPIGSGSYITRKRWYDMWIVVDLPAGSNLFVWLSTKPEGFDWELVRSITASSDMQSVRVIIPVETIANANWVRVRLGGFGPAKIHELAYRERILPI